ncbi:MAG: TIGR02186 family protein [Longimicrobiales bacterium]
MRALIQSLLLILGATLGSPPQEDPRSAEGPATLELTLEPSEVRAGMFFDGATVQVTALVPEGLGITVSCRGPEEPVVLNRKGKALGLIWMNVGEVEIDGAPELYLLHASGELGDLATASSLEGLGVGYAALERRAEIKGAGGNGEEADLFGEFVSLKESDGLYVLSEGSVEVGPGPGGRVRVTTEIHLPAKTPPGEYEILVHGFAGQNGSLLGTAPFRVVQVGMAASIRTLATEHGLQYGILAVVVAIAVGLLTGVLFGLGSKKAH